MHGAGARPMRRRSWSETVFARLDRYSPALFLLPPVALVIALSIFPLIVSLGISFCNWDASNPAAGVSFSGLQNWIRLLGDSHFWHVTINTFLYVVIGVPIEYALGLVLAIVLNREMRSRNLFRTLFLLPMMLSPVAVALVVGRILFNEDVGPINDILHHLGIAPVPWLTDNTMAFVTVLIVDVWQWTPFMMLLLLAGLQGIPREAMEAGRIDTRSEWQLFWHVVFPLLLPWTVTALLIRSIEMMKIIDVVVVLTNGGPGIATESITLYAYRTGIRDFDLGYASTIAYTLFIVVAVGATFSLRLLRGAIERVQA